MGVPMAMCYPLRISRVIQAQPKLSQWIIRAWVALWVVVLVQFATADTYDEVVAFYTDALTKDDPKSLSHESMLGRQTAFAITQENGGISVTIQEFTKEGQVSITFMQVKG